MAWAASITDFIPDAHTLFIVVQRYWVNLQNCSLAGRSLSCSGLNYPYKLHQLNLDLNLFYLMLLLWLLHLILERWVDNPHKTSDRCSNGRNDNDSFVHDIYNVGLCSKFNHFKTNFDFDLSIIFFRKQMHFLFQAICLIVNCFL
jgi:hypothetical protein